MGIIDLKKLEKIETDVKKNPDWYYHGYDFCFTSDILEKGIVAKRYLDFPCPDFGLNGKYYISIAKDGNSNDKALTRYMNNGPLAILDEYLKVIKCKNSQFHRLFIHTRIPLRYTAWSDEYQVYGKIKPDQIIGFECMVHDWVTKDKVFLLKRFRVMLEMMQKTKCNLPVYDYSRQDGNRVHEINKASFLELSESIIDNSIESILGVK